MEKREILNLIKTKYKKYLENDDLEGLLFSVPKEQRPEVASFLMYDVSQIDLLNEITEIPDYMFYGSNQVDVFIVPKHIKSIGRYAFANSSITKFKIDNGSSITEIPKGCFENCSNLSVIVLPSSVLKITAGALKGCTNIKKFVTPRRTKRNQQLVVGASDKEYLTPLLSDREEEEEKDEV